MKELSIEEFAKQNELNINNPEYFEVAFTHRSYVNEVPKVNIIHNERLEFLGDAVLELAISEYLYAKYPDKHEGDLTSIRSAVVKKETLASMARKLNFGQFLRLSRGEEATGGREKDYLLANTFEAVLGAIYLDMGYESVKSFLYRIIIEQIDIIVENRLDIDHKSQFQEISQAQFKLTPNYRMISQSGPDHSKIFSMAVYVGKKKFGEGTGPTKQKAEEEAAKKAIEYLSSTHCSDKIGKLC